MAHPCVPVCMELVAYGLDCLRSKRESVCVCGWERDTRG